MRIGIAGCGLIGGSLALALRDDHDVRAYDPAGTGDIRSVARLADLLPADVVIVATPLAQVVPTLATLAERSGDALLLDVGSLKRDVAAFADTAPATCHIVGGHPMAGTTERGYGAARGDLFHGRPFFLVPTTRSSDRSHGWTTSCRRTRSSWRRRSRRSCPRSRHSPRALAEPCSLTSAA